MFDGSGRRTKDWKALMSENGKKFAFGVGPCRVGHTLKNRHGHCIQCDTSDIAFTRRPAATARLYILGSLEGRCIKIGSSNDDLDHRVANLRSQSYNGRRDWQLLAATLPLANAGRIELAVQTALAVYRIGGGSSNRAGVAQASKEAFACGFIVASKAIGAALPADQALEVRCKPTELARYEWRLSVAAERAAGGHLEQRFEQPRRSLSERRTRPESPVPFLVFVNHQECLVYHPRIETVSNYKCVEVEERVSHRPPARRVLSRFSPKCVRSSPSTKVWTGPIAFSCAFQQVANLYLSARGIVGQMGWRPRDEGICRAHCLVDLQTF
jgi:hypothetical protein